MIFEKSALGKPLHSPLEILMTNGRDCVRFFPRVVFKCFETFGNLFNLTKELRIYKYNFSSALFPFYTVFFLSIHCDTDRPTQPAADFVFTSSCLILNLCRFSSPS